VMQKTQRLSGTADGRPNILGAGPAQLRLPRQPADQPLDFICASIRSDNPGRAVSARRAP